MPKGCKTACHSRYLHSRRRRPERCQAMRRALFFSLARNKSHRKRAVQRIPFTFRVPSPSPAGTPFANQDHSSTKAAIRRAPPTGLSTMRLKDVMTTKVQTIRGKESIERAHTCMQVHGIHHLVVVDGRSVVGL